jgi:hypothetical protein
MSLTASMSKWPAPVTPPQGDMVNVSAGGFGDAGDARVARGRRDQEDRVDRGPAQQARELDALLGRIVDDQDAVDARGLRVGDEALDAVALDRIRVAHEDDRRLGVVAAKVAHHRQHVGQADAARQRPLARLLDHRPVGHRIAERHAELDHVGPPPRP